MSYKYFLFDLDNCLLHIPNPGEYFDNVLVDTLKNLIKNINLDLPTRMQRNYFWTSGDNYLTLLEKWGVSDVSKFWKIFDKIDFACRKNLLKTKKICLYDDVVDVLKRLALSGKKLGLVSNTADYIVDFFMNYYGLNDFFHETLGLDYFKDQEIAKPSPKGILRVLNKLNFDENNDNAIMIGDSIVDVTAAKRAGIVACLIKRDPNKYPSKKNWEFTPDLEIDRLTDIYGVL
ncbi:MAG: HAD-IA family hydrolase [Candidatus Lokiarchaeota archaeon]|nr:HAD-IA family hydrolase [Candidatus Lokiarchaeota archaeon]